MKSALNTLTTRPGTTGVPKEYHLGQSSHSASATREAAAFSNQSRKLRSFDLVRDFVTHLAAAHADVPGVDRRGHEAIDWEALVTSVAGIRPIERAIGRAVVIATRKCGGVFEDDDLRVAETSSMSTEDHSVAFGDDGTSATIHEEEPFFSFSVADAIPDFGDESHRSRIAKRVAGVLGTRWTEMTPALAS